MRTTLAQDRSRAQHHPSDCLTHPLQAPAQDSGLLGVRLSKLVADDGVQPAIRDAATGGRESRFGDGWRRRASHVANRGVYANSSIELTRERQ